MVLVLWYCYIVNFERRVRNSNYEHMFLFDPQKSNEIKGFSKIHLKNGIIVVAGNCPIWKTKTKTNIDDYYYIIN